MLADVMWIVGFIYFCLSRGWGSIFPASEGIVAVFLYLNPNIYVGLYKLYFNLISTSSQYIGFCLQL